MPTPPLPSRDDEPMTPPDVGAVSMDPLDPIKHPLRDEAERAWMAGYARQGILSYSKRPPSPFAQFLQGYVAGRAALLARLNEAEARANTAKVAAEKAERERDGLRSAMDADDARLLAASEKVGRPPMGCDTADDLADAILGLRAERDALRSLMGDAIKCVSLVNANGYYDSWLARARTLSRLDDAMGEG